MSSGPARRRSAGVAASHPITASAAAANEDVQASGTASCQQRPSLCPQPSLCLACLPVWLILSPVEGLLGAVGSWYQDGDLAVTWAVTWQ